jgi:glutathione synthase/RimK-type ligase-like ATP-grasp enzyme
VALSFHLKPRTRHTTAHDMHRAAGKLTTPMRVETLLLAVPCPLPRRAVAVAALAKAAATAAHPIVGHAVCSATKRPTMPARSASRRIAFATSADYPAIQSDDAHLAATLERLGIEPVACIWNDPAMDWSRFDAVLIRTIWDYFKHHAAFLDWLDRLDQLGIPTINDSALLRWNSDKRYLLELAQLGVATIPTQLGHASELGQVLAAMRGQQVVVKPTISGGAWHTWRGVAGDGVLDQALATLPAEQDYLVQPFVPAVVSAGEWSLLYFAGAFSHAVLKRPATGDYRVQGEFGGSVEPGVPGAATLAAADRTLAALATLGHGDHAYLRVDGVISAGQFLVMELELIEPFLFLAAQPAAAERLAQDIARRMAQFPPHAQQLAASGASLRAGHE